MILQWNRNDSMWLSIKLPNTINSKKNSLTDISCACGKAYVEEIYHKSYLLAFLHWTKNIIVLTIFFSLTVHEAVILTTSGAINDENFVQKRQHFRFSVSYHSNGIRRLKSSATGMFVGQLGYVIGKENTQAPHCWTCVRGIHWCRWVGLPSQRSSNAGVFMPCRRRYPVDTRRNNNISITLKRRRNVDLTT